MRAAFLRGRWLGATGGKFTVILRGTVLSRAALSRAVALRAVAAAAAALAAVSLPGVAAAAPPAGPPQLYPSVQVSTDDNPGRAWNQPQMLVDPQDPNILVIAGA